MKTIFLSFPYISLYCCIVVLVVRFCSSGVLGGEILPGYGWEKNQVVHDELVRILALEHTLIGAGAYIHPLGVVQIHCQVCGSNYIMYFCSLFHSFCSLGCFLKPTCIWSVAHQMWGNFIMVVEVFSCIVLNWLTTSTNGWSM